MKTQTDLIGELLGWTDGPRRIVAIAGPPGVGKSTVTADIAEALNKARPGVAAVLGMDGFHYDDRVLEARGERARKGAPHTFDVDGYRAMLERLRRDDGRDVAAPVFDRDLEIARAGAQIIAGSVRVVATEGNYLLLDRPGWRELADMFDRTVMVTAGEAVLVERLIQRWNLYGYTPEQLRAKMEGNDLPNVRLVLKESRAADLVIVNE